MKRKILIANGVNLDLLGIREPKIYGNETLKSINQKILEDFPSKLKQHYELEFFQTNNEASYLEKITSEYYAALILNPGAWTHTSLALGDRLKAISDSCPIIEVHLSNTKARELIRQHSYVTESANQVIQGMGWQGYTEALNHLAILFSNERGPS